MKLLALLFSLQVFIFGIRKNVCALQYKNYWNKLGMLHINKILNLTEELSTSKARNVVLIVGDGMSLSTLRDTRALMEEQWREDNDQNNDENEEDISLSVDNFPHLGLLKTHSTNAQIFDSESTATAFMTGVKTNAGTIGVDAHVTRGNCNSYSTEHNVYSPFKYALDDGKSVGLVTNIRITSATAASLYGHSPDQSWECDADQPLNSVNNCTDLAVQFLNEAINYTVVFGGGRSKFLGRLYQDPLNENANGSRIDEQNLIKKWENMQNSLDRNYQYIWNRKGFEELNISTIEAVLGLFEVDHMQYDSIRDMEDPSINDPSLAEMTDKAIKILMKNKKGFFLLVEAGRIKHAYLENDEKKALTEAIALDDAIKHVLEAINSNPSQLEDTLILVTADHSRKYYITPGYTPSSVETDTINVSNSQEQAPPQCIHPIEDVPVFAKGPMAHLFSQTHAETHLAHVIMYASCVGPLYKDSRKCKAMTISVTVNTLIFTITMVTIFNNY